MDSILKPLLVLGGLVFLFWLIFMLIELRAKNRPFSRHKKPSATRNKVGRI